MATRSFSSVVIFGCLMCCIITQEIPLPLQVPTSSKHYGPDGPWQAVTVFYGDPGQAVDLYPASVYESIILTNKVCQGVSLTPCGSGGMFDPANSPGLDDTFIEFSGHNDGFDVDWSLGALRIGGNAHFAMDQLTLLSQQSSKVIPGLSTRLIYNVSITYPDGKEYPLQLGQLALGGSNTNQTFTVSPGIPNINASLVPGYLWEQKVIPSSSYGLHVGSVVLGMPLSLWIGGYDQSRVLGNISSQSYDVLIDLFAIDLLDIAIGMDHGGSPFPYKKRENILADGNSSITNAISVAMNPGAPYMSLPNSTCAAIAKDLPVTYQAKYGLYFWNVHDPQYTKIVTSPSFLGFTFRASGIKSVNLTVNVPFRLLNLTLNAPLIDKPTQYFPCQPPQLSSQYSLGRAFLQAAFLGVNWNQGLGKWFLAQAPGPNTGSTPSAAPYPDTFSESSSSSNAWSDTWEGFWTPLPEAVSTATTAISISTSAAVIYSEKAGTGTGITDGARAGIGTASAVGVALAIGLFLFFRRRRGGPSAPVPTPTWPQTDFKDDPVQQEQPPVVHEAPDRELSEIYTKGGPAHELHGVSISEIDSGHRGRG